MGAKHQGWNLITSNVMAISIFCLCVFLWHYSWLTQGKVNLTYYCTFTLQLQTTKIPWLAKLDINANLRN